MAFTKRDDGTRIHFEVSGRRDGEPLLLLMGLGADSRGWFLQKQALGARYRLILVDNRGMGRSDSPPGPYLLTDMAADAMACIEAAGYESAHIMGASMGGVMSQLIAVTHPEKVRSLILACTSCSHQRWRRELFEGWVEEVRENGMRAFVGGNLRWLVGPRSLRRVWPAMHVLGPLMFRAPAAAFTAQVHAILGVEDDLRTKLMDLDIPTLVLVGSQDMLTPRGDSEELAALIPDAELMVVRGGAHLFMVEHAATFNRLVLEFLDRQVTTTADVDLRGVRRQKGSGTALRSVAGGRS